MVWVLTASARVGAGAGRQGSKSPRASRPSGASLWGCAKGCAHWDLGGRAPLEILRCAKPRGRQGLPYYSRRSHKLRVL